MLISNLNIVENIVITVTECRQIHFVSLYLIIFKRILIITSWLLVVFTGWFLVTRRWVFVVMSSLASVITRLILEVMCWFPILREASHYHVLAPRNN